MPGFGTPGLSYSEASAPAQPTALVHQPKGLNRVSMRDLGWVPPPVGAESGHPSTMGDTRSPHVMGRAACPGGSHTQTRVGICAQLCKLA